jgi:transcriptional regulator of arginine metabolism
MELMKQLRQQQIRQLLEARPIRTQHELAAALRERGFRVTQATVSRDVGELGLRKVMREGVQAYAVPDSAPPAERATDERLRQLLTDLPVQIEPAGLLLVVRAVPGSAHAIAAALDRIAWPEVVGSIAGDDTVFIAVADGAALERIVRRLERVIGD